MSNWIILSFILAWVTPQEDPLLKPVRDLFKGMETADSTLVRSAFQPNAIMQSVTISETGTEVQEGNLNGFITAIGSSTPGRLSEPIWNIKIEKDGGLAQVWAEYALYVDGEFHHCGVDAFHLVKTSNGWKILLVTDTRRTSPCEIPGEIKARYKK